MRYLIRLLLAISITYLVATTSFAIGGDKNILGGPLTKTNTRFMTGTYRDGYCRANEGDTGVHVVSIVATERFLDYTKSKGNDLGTPSQQDVFPGIKPGDHWCVCAARWLEAEKAGAAPPVDLKATNEKALKYIPLETLKKYGIKP